jgi:integrase/recombinase XerD
LRPVPGHTQLQPQVKHRHRQITHLQFEALLTAARESPNPGDFALVAMLGLLGLRIFEATSANIADLGEEHGHRVLRVCGRGSKVAQVPLPPAVGRAIDRATGFRDRGPILLNGRGARMDRHAATRRLRRLAQSTGLQAKVHPHMLRHTFVTTMLDAGVDLRDVQIAARHADPRTTMRSARESGPAPTWTGTRTTSWPPTCPQQPDQPTSPRLQPGETPCTADVSEYRLRIPKQRSILLACAPLALCGDGRGSGPGRSGTA